MEFKCAKNPSVAFDSMAGFLFPRVLHPQIQQTSNQRQYCQSMVGNPQLGNHSWETAVGNAKILFSIHSWLNSLMLNPQKKNGPVVFTEKKNSM